MVKLIQMSAASVLLPCVTAHSVTADYQKALYHVVVSFLHTTHITVTASSCSLHIS